MSTLLVLSMDEITSTAGITNIFDSNDSWTYDSTGGISSRAALLCLEDNKYLIKRFRPAGAVATNNIRYYEKFKSSAPASGSDNIIWLGDVDNDIYHFVQTTSAGLLQISESTSPAGGATFHVGTTNICDNAYHTIQIYIQTGLNGAGTIQVWIDDVLEINRSGFTTWSASQFEITNFNEGRWAATDTDRRLDDLIIWDENAGGRTGKIAGVPSLIPVNVVGAGSSTDFTPVSGANWENVDDVGEHDGDTTSVSSSVAGDKDFYTTASAPGGITTIEGVYVKGDARADESAQTSARLNVKAGTTEENGATAVFSGAGYKSFLGDFPLNPDTTSAWVPGDFPIEIGPERV